jgi:hypothetical protein
MAQVVKRKTTSGDNRYDVRTRIVTRTFKRRKDADNYATTTEADKFRGVVIDPGAYGGGSELVLTGCDRGACYFLACGGCR